MDTNSNRPRKSPEEIQEIAYSFAQHLNGYELTIGEAEEVAEYFYKRILPFQLSRSLRAAYPIAFTVIRPKL